MISVVVPTYNERPERLDLTVSSLLPHVDAFNGELIIVNDGGAPVEVQGNTVRVINLPENRGPAGALNAGYEAARHALIGRCDVGDEWLPAMSAMIEHALDSGVPAIWGVTIDGLTDTSRPVRPNWQSAIWRDGQFALTGALTTKATWQRERFDESFRCADDWDWACRVQHTIGWQHFAAQPVAIATQYPDGQSLRNAALLKAARVRIIKRNRALRGRV